MFAFVSIQDTKTHLTETEVIQIYMEIHRRFLQSEEGFAILVNRWRQGDFGSCSCWRCNGTHFLPVGLDTIPGVSSVKLFCPCCKEIYNPPVPYNCFQFCVRSLLVLDGAFFARDIPRRFLSSYSGLVEKPKPEYRPAIFGFVIHPSRSFPMPLVTYSPYFESPRRKSSGKDHL